MIQNSRRAILQICGSGALCMSSGCFDILDKSDPDEGILFCELRIYNSDRTAYPVQIRFVEDDEIHYEDSGEIDAYTEETGEGWFEITAVDLPSSEGEFTLQLQLDAATQEEVDLTTGLAEPVSIVALISEGTISFFGSQDENRECESLSNEE